MSKEIEERIRFFEVVRDIPYYISLGDEADYCCATKPIILDALLSKLGLEVRHILCQFRWSKMSLPEELLQIPHDDLETHEYLEVLIPENGKWVIVDPTWDRKIKHSSVPIAEWDGLSDTVVGIPVEKVWSPEESEKLNAEEDEDREVYLQRNGKFFDALNRWLESLRRNRT